MAEDRARGAEDRAREAEDRAKELEEQVSVSDIVYSKTCVSGLLYYSKTTCIKRQLCDVPKVSACTIYFDLHVF